MIKALLIDDEMHCLKTLDLLLKEYCPDVQVLDKCGDAEDGLKAIKKRKPDLVFLDIEMPIMNGFELLEQLPEIAFAVIFTTSYDQYAIKAFRFSALDYLLKPVEPKELIAAVHKIQIRKQLPEAEQFQMLLHKMGNRESIFPKIPVPTTDGYELIPVDQILFCKADDNYTYFHLKNKQKIIACRQLKEVEEQLQDFKPFIRVHHSYIVNMNEVSRYIRGEGGYLVLSDGTPISVSKSRKDMLIQALQLKKP